ncbi:MAG: hypothetical protein ACREJQ_02930 [bacterium]
MSARRLPWSPTGVAVGTDGVVVLERRGDYYGLPPMPAFLADMLGNARVRVIAKTGNLSLLVTIGDGPAFALVGWAAALVIIVLVTWRGRKRRKPEARAKLGE